MNVDRKAYHHDWYLKNKEKKIAQCRAYYRAHKAEKVEWSKKWRLKNPEKAAAIEARFRNKHRDRLRARCREWSHKNKAYEALRKYLRRKKETPDQRAARLECLKRAYRKNKRYYFESALRRKAKLAGAAIDPAGIKEWMEDTLALDVILCTYCKNPIPRKPRQIHFDHVVPVSRGGAHALYNLCVACQTCNLSKGTKLLSEWKPDEQVHQSC